MPGTYGHLSIGRLWWFPSNNHRGRAQRAHLNITWCTFHFCRQGGNRGEMGNISIVMAKIGHITMASWVVGTAEIRLAKRISKIYGCLEK